MTVGTPLVDGGRDAATGQFLPGNKCSRGNPLGGQVARLRAEMLRAIEPDDIRAIIRKLIELARDGDAKAAKEVLDRSLGKPIESDILSRLDELEAILGEGAS